MKIFGLPIIVYCLPVLFLFIYLEYRISRKRNIDAYTFSDTIVNICCGVLERTFDLFFAVLFFYVVVYINSIHPFHIPENIFTWFCALLFADFLAYWHHRLSHRINFLWAAHIVHHQSEHLNLTTVFRVSAFAVINRAFFFIWLPIAGFSVMQTTSAIIFIGLYQFVTHTRLIHKLGFLEKLLVTPSHHRVHHGVNEQYLDKNYGHVFIIWDKLFRTYEPELEEPRYGITTGFKSANPVYAYLSYWKDLFRRTKRVQLISDKIKLFVKPPGWIPSSTLSDELKLNSEQPERKSTAVSNWPARLKIFVGFNTIIVLVVLLFLTSVIDQINVLEAISIAVFVTISIISVGYIADGDRRITAVEIVRLLFITGCGTYYLIIGHIILGVCLIASGIIIFCMFIFLVEGKSIT